MMADTIEHVLACWVLWQTFHSPWLVGVVRMNATFQSLAFIAAPILGSALLLAVGPGLGMLINSFFYVPLQNAMPEFADRLGAATSDLTYGGLLVAFGLGGVIGGVLLEATRIVPATWPVAVGSAIVLGLGVIIFAASGVTAVALLALLVAGVAKLTSTSTEMSLVQLTAPLAHRGRVIGAYNMFSFGMMTFSGLSVAVLGSAFGIAGSLLVSGSVLALGALAIGGFLARRERDPSAARGEPGGS